ncbi:MAG TPA: hypothetical protein V6C64_12700 [Microcoleaceae cyanobacterium]
MQCTFLEACRDLWIHHLIMVVQGYVIIDLASTQHHFFSLLYHVRGLQELSPIDRELSANAVRAVLGLSALQLQQVYTEWKGGSDGLD